MGVVNQIRLPDEIQEVVDRKIAEGRLADSTDFLLQAARRYAEDLMAEDEVVAAAKAGIADIEAGRYTMVSSREELNAMQERVLARVRNRLAGDQG